MTGGLDGVPREDRSAGGILLWWIDKRRRCSCRAPWCTSSNVLDAVDVSVHALLVLGLLHILLDVSHVVDLFVCISLICHVLHTDLEICRILLLWRLHAPRLALCTPCVVEILTHIGSVVAKVDGQWCLLLLCYHLQTLRKLGSGEPIIVLHAKGPKLVRLGLDGARTFKCGYEAAALVVGEAVSCQTFSTFTVHYDGKLLSYAVGPAYLISPAS